MIRVKFKFIRMLDMGFAPQLNEILRVLPKARQTLFFSATLPKYIEKLSSRFLNNPVRVTIGANLRKGSVLVFARTKIRTDRVAWCLEEYGYAVMRLHGGRTRGQRNSMATNLSSPYQNRTPITVCAMKKMKYPS